MRGAGDAAHQRRERDRDLREPALHAPGQHGRELEQVLGDAGIVEEVAGQDEQRHREQREVLRLRDGELDRDGRRQLRMLQEEQRAGDADREGDRHADQQQHREGDEDDQHGVHRLRARRRRWLSACSPRSSSRILSMVVISSSSAPDRQAHRHPGVADLGNALEAADAADPGQVDAQAR